MEKKTDPLSYNNGAPALLPTALFEFKKQQVKNKKTTLKKRKRPTSEPSLEEQHKVHKTDISLNLFELHVTENALTNYTTHTLEATTDTNEPNIPSYYESPLCGTSDEWYEPKPDQYPTSLTIFGNEEIDYSLCLYANFLNNNNQEIPEPTASESQNKSLEETKNRHN
jgi:hypothetical protein